MTDDRPIPPPRPIPTRRTLAIGGVSIFGAEKNFLNRQLICRILTADPPPSAAIARSASKSPQTVRDKFRIVRKIARPFRRPRRSHHRRLFWPRPRHQPALRGRRSPGFLRTAMTQNLKNDEARQAEIDRAHLLGGMGRPEDVARAVLLLASYDVAWITGVNLPVDGGYLIV